MIRDSLYRAWLSLAAGTILVGLGGRALAVEPPPNVPQPPNGIQNVAQPPGANVPAQPRRVDIRKGILELKTETVVQQRSAPAPAAAVANPRVEPGKVRWHADFAAACAASQKSGKPVLLFQMMGKLDEQFC